MHLIQDFLNSYAAYLKELFVPVAVGFLISGFLNEYIPSKFIDDYLGKKGIKAILIASFLGMLLPVCCFGSLPIAMTLQKKGARLGPVLAFLVATPATSVSALFVCWKLLGSFFTVYIFFAVLVMGILIGMIGNAFSRTSSQKEAKNSDCCHDKNHHEGHSVKLQSKVRNILVYAFVTLPKEIGIELLLGVAIASLILVFTPLQSFIGKFLTEGAGYVFSLVVGLGTYVCSTASVPMADAFVKSGMGYGPAMVYLLIGPVTSYGALLALKKTFGLRIFTIYIITICITSLLLGIGFDLLANYYL